MYVEFAEKAGHPLNIDMLERPQIMKFRLRLIKEEVTELFEAVDDVYKTKNNDEYLDAKANLLKELADVQYTLSGFATTFNLDLEETFKRVHESNLTKFLGDIEYDAEGKVKKGSQYKPPNLEDLV